MRGGVAKLTKGDRRPYVEANDAEKLLLDALKRNRAEHHNLPARVVIHKSSQEIDGLQSAAAAKCITDLELIALGDSLTPASAKKLRRRTLSRLSTQARVRLATFPPETDVQHRRHEPTRR